MQEIVEHKVKKRKTRIADDERELDRDDIDLLRENLGEASELLTNKEKYKRIKGLRGSDDEGVFLLCLLDYIACSCSVYSSSLLVPDLSTRLHCLFLTCLRDFIACPHSHMAVLNPLVRCLHIISHSDRHVIATLRLCYSVV